MGGEGQKHPIPERKRRAMVTVTNGGQVNEGTKGEAVRAIVSFAFG